MKALGLTKMLSLVFLMTGWIAASGQNQEVPGDDFSLEGALELFKKSSSPEEFERMLNSSDARVNNLDLNGDGEIDYIKVIDKNDGNVHAFILQAVVSPTELQDVAVIELEKLANGKAVLQITGDEDIYGVETIIEPTQEVRVNAGASTARTTVNVWAWPSVQYIYGPYYAGWISPWAWTMRPIWWNPWRPVAYYQYNSWWSPYRPYYAVCYSHRVYYAQGLYRPYRRTSVVVYNRHHAQIAHYRSSGNDHNGRDRYDGRNGGGRQYGSSGHYDSNGRLASSTSQHRDTRSYVNKWSQPQGRSDNGSRPSKQNSYGTRSTDGVHSTPSSSQYTGNSDQRSASQKWSGTSGNSSRSRQDATRPSVNSSSSSGSSGVQRSRIETSGSSHIQRSTGGSSQGQSSGVKRSSIGTSGSSNIQRSAGGSSQRQSSGVQRSSIGTSGSSHIQRSGGGASGHSSATAIR